MEVSSQTGAAAIAWRARVRRGSVRHQRARQRIGRGRCLGHSQHQRFVRACVRTLCTLRLRHTGTREPEHSDTARRAVSTRQTNFKGPQHGIALILKTEGFLSKNIPISRMFKDHCGANGTSHCCFARNAGSALCLAPFHMLKLLSRVQTIVLSLKASLFSNPSCLVSRAFLLSRLLEYPPIPHMPPASTCALTLSHLYVSHLSPLFCLRFSGKPDAEARKLTLVFDTWIDETKQGEFIAMVSLLVSMLSFEMDYVCSAVGTCESEARLPL